MFRIASKRDKVQCAHCDTQPYQKWRSEPTTSKHRRRTTRWPMTSSSGARQNPFGAASGQQTVTHDKDNTGPARSTLHASQPPRLIKPAAKNRRTRATWPAAARKGGAGKKWEGAPAFALSSLLSRKRTRRGGGDRCLGRQLAARTTTVKPLGRVRGRAISPEPGLPAN